MHGLGRRSGCVGRRREEELTGVRGENISPVKEARGG